MSIRNRPESSIALVLALALALAGCTTKAGLSNVDASVHEQRDAEFNEATVIKRLEDVGYSREEAIARLDTMTADEIEFFAQHPGSIRRTGFVVLLGLLFSSSYSTEQGDKNKKSEEESRTNREALEDLRDKMERERLHDRNRKSEEEARANRKALEDMRHELERERLLRRIEALEGKPNPTGQNMSGHAAEIKATKEEIRELKESLSKTAPPSETQSKPEPVPETKDESATPPETKNNPVPVPETKAESSTPSEAD